MYKWESYSHPISDVRDWSKNNRLELKPDFQRNEVWSKAAQIMLIDTILSNIPIPKIYIKATIKDEDTYRIVIDGQQRLTAILKFVNDEFSLDKPYQGEFSGCRFSDLPNDVKNAILRYKIDINEIFNPSDDEIRDLYARVNKYTVQLNKQELRRADFPGDLINLAEELSEIKFFSDNGIFTVRQRRRMLDVEFVEELLSILIIGIQDKKSYLDQFCEDYMVMEDRCSVYETFMKIIDDMQLIFDTATYPIYNTRFKQKSDFYSLFSSIFYLHNNGFRLNKDKIDQIRNSLKEMDLNIGPQSEIDEYRDYAVRCLSDANSSNYRKWRQEFLLLRLEHAYINEE